MAERIDIDMGQHGGYRWSKYPWDDWADGATWRLERGADYEVHTSSLLSAARAYARTHGLRVRSQLRRDIADGVEIQFTRESDESERAAA